MNIFSDHTKMEKPISTPQAQALAQHIGTLKKYFSHSKRAVLTDKKVSDGMMRMLSVFLEKIPVELRDFYSKEDGEEWLSK